MCPIEELFMNAGNADYMDEYTEVMQGVNSKSELARKNIAINMPYYNIKKDDVEKFVKILSRDASMLVRNALLDNLKIYNISSKIKAEATDDIKCLNYIAIKKHKPG